MIEAEDVVGIILSLEPSQPRQLLLAVDLLKRFISPRVVLVNSQIVVAGGGSQVAAESYSKLVGWSLNGVTDVVPSHLDHAVEETHISLSAVESASVFRKGQHLHIGSRISPGVGRCVIRNSHRSLNRPSLNSNVRDLRRWILLPKLSHLPEGGSQGRGIKCPQIDRVDVVDLVVLTHGTIEEEGRLCANFTPGDLLNERV